MITFFFLGIGLIIGSFLNAVHWRMREGMGLGGRSMCPACRTPIRWYDNIPILSYVILRGKCRSCRVAIPLRYPAVEGTTGVLFALIGSATVVSSEPSSWALAVFLCFFISIGILVFVADLATMEIPTSYLWIGVFVSIVFLLVWDVMRFDEARSVMDLRLYSGLIGGFVGFVPLFLIAALSKEKWMGMGDGFLAFFLGLGLGWPGSLFALVVGFGLGSMIGIGLLGTGRALRDTAIPLGPFLVAGAVIVLLATLFFPENEWLFVRLT